MRAEFCSRNLEHFQRRPIRWLVGGQSAIDRVDAKRKQPIKFGMKALQSRQTSVEQIPVERFKMADIENGTVPLRNWPVKYRIRLHDGEECVTSPASLMHALD